MLALSLAAFRVLNRLESEHMAHGGAENGKLPVMYADFERSGVHSDAIAPALRELEALGLIEIVRHGYAGVAEKRTPNLYRLTYVGAWNAGKADATGTHEYLRIKTVEDAERIGRTARKAADARNVQRAKIHFATPGIRKFSPPEMGGETPNSRPRNPGAHRPPPETGGTIYISEGSSPNMSPGRGQLALAYSRPEASEADE
jgi:hypothetical protein